MVSLKRLASTIGPRASPTMSTFVHLPAGEAASSFGRRPFALRHELAAHPLIQPESLAELADSLAPDQVEHNSGQVDAVTPDGSVPRADLSPGEIVRTIETNNCWIVLPIHDAPAYRDLYAALFDDVRPHLPPDQGDIVVRQAVFFLATGGSTTPAHIDLEQGLLLHLRGEKEVQIGGFPDPATAQQKIERMHRGEHRNIAQPPQDPRRFDLRPGDGVHIPAFTPHVVHTAGRGVSLSLAIAMKTEATLRESAVHRANGHLRRLGMKPRQPGVNPRSDRVKHRLVDAVARRRRAA
jgi:hypothetical protein